MGTTWGHAGHWGGGGFKDLDETYVSAKFLTLSNHPNPLIHGPQVQWLVAVMIKTRKTI